MKLVVFGASGGVGRHLVTQASEAGHEVVAISRRPLEAPKGVEVAIADVLRDDLATHLEGADAVLSALGIRRRFVWNPWSAILGPHDLASVSARRIAATMTLVGVRKVVAVSAAGVGDSASGMNPAFAALVRSSSIGVAYRDLAEMERVYLDADLQACCARPVTLTDGAYTGRVREVGHFGALMSIARADVAGWMLQAIQEPSSHTTPQIAGARR